MSVRHTRKSRKRMRSGAQRVISPFTLGIDGYIIISDFTAFYGKGGLFMLDGTRRFTLTEDSGEEMKRVLITVYDALREKGYNPINQIVGYILSEDPTYITNHNNARSLIRKIDRDELLQELVRQYLSQ